MKICVYSIYVRFICIMDRGYLLMIRLENQRTKMQVLRVVKHFALKGYMDVCV